MKGLIEIKSIWNKNEYDILIDYINNKKINYLNEFVDILDKDLDDICNVLGNELKDKIKRGSKVKLKLKCDYCKTNEIEINLSVYLKNKNVFCSQEHYWEFKKLPEQKGENFHSYKRIKMNCDFCNKEMIAKSWNHKNRNKNNFCSKECYWKFRKIHYTGENHNCFGTKKTEEQKERMREITVKRYVDGEFGTKKYRNTKIQLKIDELLNLKNINFEKEKIIGYYACDNYLTDFNLIIENNGDFFHVNPNKYKEKNSLHKIQSRTIKKDKSKNTYMKKYNNINILYLWETDINQRIDVCDKLIDLYINNNGILEDYNSFNYEIIKDNLKLKKQITIPYINVESATTNTPIPC